MKWSRSLKVELGLYIVVGVFLVLAVSSAIIISTVSSQQEEMAYRESIEMASNYANQFDTDFRSNQVLVETLAGSLERYDSMIETSKQHCRATSFG